MKIMYFETARILISAFAVIFVYILSGRMVAAHTAPRGIFLTPISALLVGMGLWNLWFISLSAGFFASIDITFYLFGGATLLLTTGMYQTLKSSAETEHFWSKLVTSSLIIFPLWAWLAKDTITTAPELGITFKNMAETLNIGRLPTLETSQFYGIHNLQTNAGTWINALPISIIAQKFASAGAIILNLITLLGVAGALSQASKVRVKYSNLPLVSATSVLGVTAFNPFFSMAHVTTAVPDILISTIILMLAMPLISPQPLPKGISNLPIALMAFLLAFQGAETWPILLTLLAMWGFRCIFVEEFHRTIYGLITRIFGWVILVTIPIIGISIWQKHLLANGFSPNVSTGAGVNLTNQPLLIAGGITAFVLLGALWRLVHIRKFGGIRLFWLSQAVWIIPATLILVIIFNKNMDLWRSFTWLQFIILLPLWRLYLGWYQKSDLKTSMWKAPWTFGSLLALVLFCLVITTKPLWQPPVPAPFTHANIVANKAIESQKLPAGLTLAVLGSQSITNAMGFALKHKNPVINANLAWVNAKNQRNVFHNNLANSGANFLWIHTITPAVNNMFQRNLKPAYSYLFRIDKTSFTLLATYPHLNYTVGKL